MTMDKINFWTPVQYGKNAACPAQRIVEWVDSYFNTKRTVAVIVPGMMQGRNTGVKLQEENQPLWQTILKVASYATLIIPTLLLCVKCAFRVLYTFYLCERTLSNGIVEKGVFVNGVLRQGTRIENGKTFYIAPKLLIEDSIAGIEDGLEINFAEVMIDGAPQIIPIERKIGENAYVNSVESPYSILLEMANLDPSIVTFVLEHPSNHLMTLQDFVQFLTHPDEDDNFPIYDINIETVREVLELIQKNNIDINIPIIDGLFLKWAGQGQLDLMRSLLALRPEVIQQNLQPVSSLTLALLNGNLDEATLFLEAMRHQNIMLSQMENLLYKTALHQNDFTEDELRKLSHPRLSELFQVANVFINKPCIETLRHVFPYLPPMPPRPSSLFSLNMDAITVADTLEDFLRELRMRNQLFSQQEFQQLDNRNYTRTDKHIGHLIAEKRLEQYFSVVKHIAVMKAPSRTVKFQVGPAKSMSLFSNDFDIYAEKITPIDRKATREEISSLLRSLCSFGVHLSDNEHLMIGRNENGAEGIYLTDIDQMQLSETIHIPSMNCLKKLASPEDHAWLQQEIQTMEQFYTPFKAHIEEALNEYHRIMEPTASRHGFGLLRTFNIPFLEERT